MAREDLMKAEGSLLFFGVEKRDRSSIEQALQVRFIDRDGKFFRDLGISEEGLGKKFIQDVQGRIANFLKVGDIKPKESQSKIHTVNLEKERQGDGIKEGPYSAK